MKPGAPITTEPTLNATHASRESLEDQIGALIGVSHGASNEWVVAGSRTITGKPILANDPHLDLSAPILWYLVRIVTPEGSVKGGDRAWNARGLDRSERLDRLGLHDRQHRRTGPLYRDSRSVGPLEIPHPRRPKPFETRVETIHVKDGADINLTVRATRHGPVLSDVSEDLGSLVEPGKAIALAFTGLGDRDTTAEAFMHLNGARNWDEFLDAMRLYQTPTQNIVYADVAGDIGFFSPGLVPLRKSGDGLAPVDGASGDFDWIGTIPFEQLPQLHNPEIGFAFNANNANVPNNHQPTFGQDWEEDFRARRIQQFMDTIDKHSLDTSAAMQADHLSLAAKALAAVHRHDRAFGRARATGAGDARELGRGDGQGPRRAADLHRISGLAPPNPARREDGPENGGARPVRRRPPLCR